MKRTNAILLLSIVLYFAGLFLSPRQNIDLLKEFGMAKQEYTIYYDSDGDEHESESLIEICGIGPVLTYTDVYLAALPFLIVACLLGKIIFNSTDELRFMIFTNCVLGVLLLWLTSKPHILSTVLYWSGIVTASFIPNNHAKQRDDAMRERA